MNYGYADLHCHPMAHLAFGGEQDGRSLFWGNPMAPVERALPGCSCAHAPWHFPWSIWSVLPKVLEFELTGGGFDSFESWPRPTSTIHQQMHISQVRRAFNSGLRLMVACAVNNELLADKYHGPCATNSDDTVVDAQIVATEQMVGENREWMTIVKSPMEARQAFRDNKLAVVLAVEVDSIAGPTMRRESQSSSVPVSDTIDKWWWKGVRMITPIHLADNALGGAAVYDDRFNFLNHYLITKHSPDLPKPWFFEVVNAATVPGAEGVNFTLSRAGLYSLIYGATPCYDDIPGVGHVNRRGLSEAGKAFIKGMMARGMLIDVEHMSTRSVWDTLEIAIENDYPLISSHTSIRELAVRGAGQRSASRVLAHEAMRSDAVLREIQRLGGVLGIGAHVGPTIKREVDDSANWMLSYRYALEGLGFSSVAIGTDMNGLARAPGPRFERTFDQDEPRPRFRREAVRHIRYRKDRVPLVRALLDRNWLGRRDYDFNFDGLAHYGLLPDFTTDVALSLGTGTEPDDQAMKPFFTSARAFVDAWAKCVARSQTPRLRSVGRLLAATEPVPRRRMINLTAPREVAVDRRLA